jgi:hypothetical protein
MDEQALSYAEIKALCAGNPLIAEKMGLDVEVAKLKMLKANHQSQLYNLEDNLRLKFPKQIETAKANIEGYKSDAARLELNTVRVAESISPMTIGANNYTERKDAGAALIEACRGIKGIGSDKIGSYRGFEISISFDTATKEYKCHLKGAMTHTTALGSDPVGNITRIDNALDKIPALLKDNETKLETLYGQVENAKSELAKPFPQEAALLEKSARLTELDTLLSLDGKDGPPAEARDGDAHTKETSTTVSAVEVPKPPEARQAPTIPQPVTAVMARKEAKTEDNTPTVKPPVKKKSHDAR